MSKMKKPQRIDLTRDRKQYLVLIIVLSSSWIALGVFISFGMTVIYSPDEFFQSFVENLIITSIAIGFACYIMLIFLWIGVGRAIQIEIDEQEFRSIWLRRTVCTVKRYEPIYYIMFDGKEDPRFPTMRFVLISNTPIEGMSKPPAVSIYKIRKFLILPFNEKTKAYIDLDNWTCCGLFLDKKR